MAKVKTTKLAPKNQFLQNLLAKLAKGSIAKKMSISAKIPKFKNISKK